MSSPELATGALPAGTRLGEFELQRHLGDGGFSIVYLAWDHSLERAVALKEYLPAALATRVHTDQGHSVQPRSAHARETFDIGLRSFINEARALAQFDHPALVKVHRFWEAQGTAYMAMPYYQGHTLKQALREMPAAPDEAWLLRLLDPLTEALAVIHAADWYHRDIAPDNIILLAETGLPLLLDFGAARRVVGERTQALTAILKPGYAPVEQYAEVPGMKQGAWTDVYALAATVHHAITGKAPTASVARILEDNLQPLAQRAAGRYSAPFLQALDKALAVRPEQRTRDMAQLRQQLGLNTSPLATAAPPRADGAAQTTVLRPLARASRAAPATRAALPASASKPAVLVPAGAPTATTLSFGRAALGAAGLALAVALWAWRSGPGPVPVAAPSAPIAPWIATPPAPPVAPPAAPPAAPPVAAPASLPAAPSAPLLASPAPTATAVPALAQPDAGARVAPERAPERVPERAPERVSERSAERAAQPAPPASRPARARRTSPEPRPLEVPAPVAATPAPLPAPTAAPSRQAARECAALLQRMSLGESNPDIDARLARLNCR